MTEALTIIAVMALGVISLLGLAVLCIAAFHIGDILLTKYLLWRGIYKDFLAFMAMRDAERRGEGQSA